MDVRDNRLARRMHTQVRVIARTLMIIVGLIGGAAALMTFDSVRQFGLSILASAGIAGLILGLAARPTFENIIAGIQIALTQPITLDDAVVVEGEWGWIEEITATYVVVKVWDERRLIVPFKRFIEQPFQNWTRTTADIIGTVFIHCDYAVPVADVRAELKRLCEANDKWDKRVCVLQVTEAGERAIQLRALVSAADSPTAWDLRCEIREQLVAFIRDNYPRALPRVRAELDIDEDGPDAPDWQPRP
jgi:small-conductance mechanosensitive channel